jgi:hypothetical protein
VLSLHWKENLEKLKKLKKFREQPIRSTLFTGLFLCGPVTPAHVFLDHRRMGGCKVSSCLALVCHCARRKVLYLLSFVCAGTVRYSGRQFYLTCLPLHGGRPHSAPHCPIHLEPNAKSSAFVDSNSILISTPSATVSSRPQEPQQRNSFTRASALSPL